VTITRPAITFCFVIESREMDWFKDHAYMAPWLAPCVTVIVALLQNKGRFANINWKVLMFYTVFLVAFALGFVPSLDEKTRTYARNVFFFMIVPVMWDVFPNRHN